MRDIISQKGATSVIIATLLLSVLLVIGLGVAILMLQQIRMSGQVGQSVVAFYAADAGAEKCIYQIRKETTTGCDDTGQISETIGSGTYQASYTANYIRNGLDTITSIGQFLVTNRKVELTWTP